MIDEEATKQDEKSATFSESYLPKLSKAVADYWFLFKMCLTSDPKFKKYLTKSAEKRAAKGINSVSRVDRVSRIIFPLFFLCLNIIYW